jgi:hypothetical protein
VNFHPYPFISTRWPLALAGGHLIPGRGEFEVPISFAASSYRNFKFKSRYPKLMVARAPSIPSSHQKFLRLRANFGIGVPVAKP